MQYTEPLSQRPNISEHVTHTLRHMISDGRLPEGQRINEVQLSASLGVSRTPLREALMGLVAEGALLSIPRRGYFVQELTVDEFQSLYAIRVLLDPEALRVSEQPGTQQLEELEVLNNRLKGGGIEDQLSVDDTIDLDDQFHMQLVSGCANMVLQDLIRQFMGRTRRYEYAYMQQSHSVSNAYEQHEAIIGRLRVNDREGACAALLKNLTSGVEPITNWLLARASSK